MEDEQQHPQEKRVTELERFCVNFGVHPEIYPRLQELGFHRLTYIQYYAALYGLFHGKDLLVCAATSAGKTLVGELACLNAILVQKKRCLYLVPLRSLASEKLDSFRKRWGRLGVNVEMSTGDMSLLDRDAEDAKLKSVNLLVATYERADSILRSHPNWFATVKVVVIDEIHNIGSEGRGARLEGLMIRLKELFTGIQFIGLSATIENPHDIAEWMGAELVRHDHRPVPLTYEIVECTSEGEQGPRVEEIKRVVKETLQEGGSMLVFTPTRNEAAQLCSELSKYVKKEELSYLFNTGELWAIVNQKRDELGLRFEQRLFFSIPTGVAFHHAGLSFEMRKLVEQLFRDGKIKIITCTPTLSAGVNLPAKVVVIKDVGLTREYLLLKSNRLHQMCGRAGRPGFDDRGHAMILATEPGEAADINIMYFRSHRLDPKYTDIISQFMSPDNLLEQYLVWIAEAPRGIQETKLRELTFQTYWYIVNKRLNPDTTVDHLIRVGYYALENLLIRYSTPESYRRAHAIPEDKVVIRSWEPDKLGGIVYDRTYIKCSFSRESPMCGCGSFDKRNRLRAKWCQHLIRLAEVAYSQNPQYTHDIVLAAVHEERLVDKLLKFDMIKIRNNRLRVTPFGWNVFSLYIRPTTAHWIRYRISWMMTKNEFFKALMYVYKKERQKKKLDSRFNEVLVHILHDEYDDLTYHLGKIAQSQKLPPGDVEEFAQTIRWIVHAFHTLAEMDGIGKVLAFTEPAMLKLIPSFATKTNPPELPSEEVPPP